MHVNVPDESGVECRGSPLKFESIIGETLTVLLLELADFNELIVFCVFNISHTKLVNC